MERLKTVRIKDNRVAEALLIKLKDECKEIKVEEESRTLFVLVKNLEYALNGKTNVALQFLKVKNSLDKDYTAIKTKIEQSKVKRIKAKIKARQKNIVDNDLALIMSKGDDASDEIPEEKNKAVELIRNPSVTRRFSNRFRQFQLPEETNLKSRSSHFLTKEKKSNTIEREVNSSESNKLFVRVI